MSHFEVRWGSVGEPEIIADDDAIEERLSYPEFTEDYRHAVLEWARHNPAATSSYTIGHGDERPADVWRYNQSS